MAAAPEALVGARAAQKMLGELEQLTSAASHAPQRRGTAQRAVTPPGQPSREPRLWAGAGFHGQQRLAAAPEALVGARAAKKMLGELEQLDSALKGAPQRRGAA